MAAIIIIMVLLTGWLAAAFAAGMFMERRTRWDFRPSKIAFTCTIYTPRILHLMGFDHEKFTYRYAGRDFRLTDVHGHVVREIVG